MRAIDADRLKRKIKKELYASHAKPIVDWIDAQPTITERTAEITRNHPSVGGCTCSACNNSRVQRESNYCHNCGAKFKEADHV